MRFGLVDLRLFLHVAETGSITAGAERANMALASASARIRGMEEALGGALLERGRRGIALTPAGRALLRHARIVLEQIGQMRGELAKYAGGFKGCVRVLANTAAASEFLPEALSAFLVAHPDIDIELEERPSYDIVRAVAEGAADAGVLASIVDPGGLETFPFATDRLVAVMPRAHPLAARRRLAFRELLDHEFVGLGGASALQRHLTEHGAQAGLALKLRVRVNGFDAICRMVENGVGLAVIPETAALRCRKSMAIRIAQLADAWALRRLSICVRRLDALPAYARQLVHHLEAWADRGAPSADASDGRLAKRVE